MGNLAPQRGGGYRFDAKGVDMKFHGNFHKPFFRMTGQHHDGHIESGIGQVGANGFNQLQTVHGPHLDVADGRVIDILRQTSNRLGPVFDHIHIGTAELFQNAFDNGPDKALIVDQQDAFTLKGTAVP